MVDKANKKVDEWNDGLLSDAMLVNELMSIFNLRVQLEFLNKKKR